MANREGYKVRLGVFVVSGVVLGLAGLLAFGAGRVLERTVPFRAYFSESVQGLSPGADIRYRGVQIGRVKEIVLRPPAGEAAVRRDAKTIIEVRGEMFPKVLAKGGAASPGEADVETFLRKEVARGLRVRLQWKDITGQKYLDVDYADPRQFPPPDLGFAPEEPCLPTATSASLEDIQRDLATTLAQLAKVRYDEIGQKVETLLDALTRTVGDLQGGAVTEKIQAAADAVRDLARDPRLGRTLDRLEALTRDLEVASARTRELVASPEVEQGLDDAAAAAASLRRAADVVARDLPGVLDEMRASARDLRAALEASKLPETAAAVREGLAGVAGAGRSVTAVREDLRTALRDIGDASRGIARLTRYLERHPDALLSGRHPGGSEER